MTCLPECKGHQVGNIFKAFGFGIPHPVPGGIIDIKEDRSAGAVCSLHFRSKLWTASDPDLARKEAARAARLAGTEFPYPRYRYGELLAEEGRWDEASEVLDDLLESGDVVLVKASRVMGLETVVEGIVNPRAH